MRLSLARYRWLSRTAVLVVAAAGGVGGCNRTASYLAPPAADDSRTGLGQVHAALSTALREEYRGAAARKAAPVSLVPTDGSELELRALSAAVTIEGPLAHTELRFTFRNGEKRQREGRFSISLPPDAAIGRFAMRIGESWREARVVTRERGREVYERFLHRKVDPALLEQDLGNQFSARVFPIAPESDKEIIVAYDHRVSATQPYTLALEGLPRLPVFALSVVHDGVARTREQRDAAPEDVVLAIADGSAAVVGEVGAGDGAAAVGAGRAASEEAFVARIEPAAAPAVGAPLDRVLFLVDTSASRGPVMGRQVELVRRLVTGLPPEASVVIAAFDHGVEEVYRGRAGAAGGAVGALYERGALGASDLGGALARAAVAGMSRVVIVGDGVPTLGEHDPARLAALVRGTALARLDAIQIGQSLDRDTLAAVVGAGREPGAILDGRDAEGVLRRLAIALPPEEPIRVEGAAASFPATTRGLAPGEPIWVAGRRARPGSLVVRIGARTVELAPRPAEAARVRRAAARAELATLTETLQGAQSEEERAALGKRIEVLALANYLVSPRTSLIVLESDADEQRVLTAVERGEAPVPGTPEAAKAAEAGEGETIVIQGRAPIIDMGSTRTGVTITNDFVRNVPTGRTFSASFAGATAVENQYVVDGLSATRVYWVYPYYGSMSLPLEIAVDRLRSTAAPFGWPQAGDGASSRASWGSPKGADPWRGPSPYTGELAAVMSALSKRELDGALARAVRWQLAGPGDVAAVLALGESLEARGAGALAARAYGSLMDLYPNRAELLRTAGERLDRVAASEPAARALAVDAYRRALRERPDHVTTYRLLAFALLREGRGEEAIDVLGAAMALPVRESVRDILIDDAGVIAAVVVARDPGKRRVIAPRMRRGIAEKPSLRIVLSWETDANDVDLHVRDGDGGHAFYGKRTLASGGTLLDDITTGYGPEQLAVDAPAAFPYRIGVHYYDRGPMGVGLGTVQVIRHDGAGQVSVEDRPFAIQRDGGTIDLGEVVR